MTLNDELGKRLNKMLQKAHRALKSAELLASDDDYDSASSKAYYAVFHALQTVLLTKGLSYSKHSGVISGFSQYFIKTGIFPEEFSMEIRNLCKNREIGDYNYILSINKEKAEEDMKTATRIVEIVENYLKKELE